MTTRQKAERACDDAFRDFIRWRDAKWGMRGPCFTCFPCRAERPLKYGTVGHFRKRRHHTIRWHERNSHLICLQCQNEGKSEENDLNYEYWLDITYGQGTAEELTVLSHKRGSLAVWEIDEIAYALRKRITESKLTK